MIIGELLDNDAMTTCVKFHSILRKNESVMVCYYCYIHGRRITG